MSAEGSSSADTGPLGSSAALRERIERLGLEFLTEFLEIALRHHPENMEALAELGHVYTRQGRLREGLELDRRLVRLAPDNPTVHYNLACSLALCGEPQDALDALETAVRLGYSDGRFLSEDEDLRSLRAEPRFRALVSALQDPGSSQDT
jgi:tetratricopeptide (TPR) repeat protein